MYGELICRLKSDLSIKQIIHYNFFLYNHFIFSTNNCTRSYYILPQYIYK